jgi:hypothetical protein
VTIDCNNALQSEELLDYRAGCSAVCCDVRVSLYPALACLACPP